MLHIASLGYVYGSTSVLCIDAFDLAPGEQAIILGPSGCGKSTLLHLIAATLTLQQGNLHVNGVNLKSLSPRQADAWRGKTIGFLPQKLALIPHLSTTENLFLSTYASGQHVDTSNIKLAAALLATLGSLDKRDAMPHQLSQGEKQRVAIARALFNQPKLVLADEPTANLDDAACDAAIGLLRAQTMQINASLLIATHDARVVNAMPFAKIMRLPGRKSAA